VIGKPNVHKELWPFCGLSQDGVEKLWTSFNELSEHFALSPNMWNLIWWDAREVLPFSTQGMSGNDFENICNAAFKILDTDHNDLVDALEIMAVFCLLSSAPVLFKVRFLFTMYDFDSKDRLALDEMTLLLKTTANGLLKIIQEEEDAAIPLLQPPLEKELEAISQNAFTFSGASSSASIPWTTFCKFVTIACPQVETWMTCFDDVRPWENGQDTDQQSNFKIVQAEWSRDRDVDPSEEEPPRKGRMWEETIVETEPSEPQKERNRQIPNVQFSLEQVIGFNHGCGVEIASSSDDLIYAASCVGMKVVRETNEQFFYRGHNLKIRRLAVHPDGEHVATFAKGANNSVEVHVWSMKTMDTVNRLAANLFDTVHDICFGGVDNEFLVLAGFGASEGCNYYKSKVTLAVYRWQDDVAPVFSTRVVSTKAPSTGLTFTTSNKSNTFVLTSLGSAEPIFYECSQNDHDIWWDGRRGIICRKDSDLWERQQLGISCVFAVNRCKKDPGTGLREPSQNQPEGNGGEEDYDDLDHNGHQIITGSVSGDIVIWCGRNTSTVVQDAHPGGVSCFSSCDESRIISCGKDLSIKVWGLQHAKCLHTIAMSGISQPPRRIVASKHTSRVLLETHCRGVFELDIDDTVFDPREDAPLIIPMKDATANIHPNNSSLLTTVDAYGAFKSFLKNDGTSVIFSSSNLNAPKWMHLRKGEVRCLSGEYTKCGTLYAACITESGEVKDGNEGVAVVKSTVRIFKCTFQPDSEAGNIADQSYDEDEGKVEDDSKEKSKSKEKEAEQPPMVEIAVLKDFKQTEACMLKFSPDGALLAVASANGKVYMYDVNDLRVECKLAQKEEIDSQILCRGKIDFSLDDAGSRNCASAMDFSIDSLFLRVEFANNGTSEEIHFIDLENLSLCENISTLKDQTWASATCTYAWGIHGAWLEQKKEDYTRNPCTACILPDTEFMLDRSESDEMEGIQPTKPKAVAIGRRDGSIDVTFWPNISRESGDYIALALQGQSGQIRSMISVVYEHKKEGKKKRKKKRARITTTELLVSVDDDTIFLRRYAVDTDDLFLSNQLAYDFQGDPRASKLWPEIVTKKQKDKYQVGLKWVNELKFPLQRISQSRGSSAGSSLHLKWVHGVNFELRDGIHYVLNDKTHRSDLVYSAGRVVVSVDPEQRRQRHYCVSEGNITCIRVKKNFICVGTSRGFVLVVDNNTLHTIATIRVPSPPIYNLEMDPTASFFVCCYGRDRNKFRVYNWKFGAAGLLHEFSSGGSPTTGLLWHPTGNSSIALCGLNYISFPNFTRDHVLLNQVRTFKAVKAKERRDIGERGEEEDVEMEEEEQEEIEEDLTLPEIAFLAQAWCKSKERKESGDFEYSLLLGDDQGTIYSVVQGTGVVFSMQKAHSKPILSLKVIPKDRRIDENETNETDALITGSGDGFVKVWNIESDGLSPVYSIDTSTFTEMGTVKGASGVVSLAYSPYGYSDRHTRLAIGISNAQIIQIDFSTRKIVEIDDERPLVLSHFGSGCSVAAHPKLPNVYASVGNDMWLYIYRTGEGIIFQQALGAGGRCCQFSYDGTHLVVGMTGTFFTVYRVYAGGEELKPVHENGDTGQSGGKLTIKKTAKLKGITDIKFDPKGAIIGVASGNKITFYDTTNDFKRLSVFDSHPAEVQSFDFDFSGEYSISIDSNGTLMYCKVKNASLLEGPPSKKGLRWARTRITGGEEFAYLWEPKSNKRHEQQQIMASCINRAGTLVAIGERNRKGTFKLCPFPVPPEFEKSAIIMDMHSDSSYVSGVTFLCEDDTLVVCDNALSALFEFEVRKDVSLFAVKTGGAPEQTSEEEEKQGTSAEIEEKDVENMEEEVVDPSIFVPAEDWVKIVKAKSAESPAYSYSKETPGQALAEYKSDDCPNTCPGQLTGPPINTIQLEHVYGRNVSASGPSITDSGKLLGCAAKLGTIFDTKTGMQWFSSPNNADEISSMAIDPSGRWAASAGLVGNGVVIWDTHTGVIVSNKCTVHSHGTLWSRLGLFDDKELREVFLNDTKIQLAFSPESTRLCGLISTESGDFSRLIIWRASLTISKSVDWASHVSVERVSTVPPLLHPFIAWSGLRSITVGGENSLCFVPDVVPNIGMHTYWLPPNDTGAVGYGLTEEKPKLCFTAVAYLISQPGSMLVATNTGILLEWVQGGSKKGRTVLDCCESGAYISALAPGYQADFFVSGDSRGFVKIWSSDLSPLKTCCPQVDLTSFAGHSPLQPLVKWVSINKQGTRIVATVASGDSFLISVQSGDVGLLEAPHTKMSAGTNQVWAMGVNPADGNILATAGDDGLVRVWNTLERKLLNVQTRIEEESGATSKDCAVRSLEWSPSGFFIAVGYGDSSPGSSKAMTGGFSILNSKTLDVLFHGRDSKSWIRDIKFSPNEDHLGVASDDGNIYLYQAKNGFKLSNICEGPQLEPVLAIDFASESTFVRSVDTKFRQHIYNCNNGERVEHPSKLKDLEWATSHCTVSWGTQGFWSLYNKGECDVLTSTDRNSSKEMLLCGDKSGTLHLSNYPFLKAVASNRTISFKGHYGAISKAVFAPDSKTAFSVGAQDCSIFQWNVVKNPNRNISK